jgi:hypothetical protein
MPSMTKAQLRAALDSDGGDDDIAVEIYTEDPLTQTFAYYSIVGVTDVVHDLGDTGSGTALVVGSLTASGIMVSRNPPSISIIPLE